MIEAWGSEIGKIISACETTGTATPQWSVKPGGLSLEFIATDVSHGYPVHSGYADKGRDILSQPESQRGSLKEMVLRHLLDGQMPKAEISKNLGKKTVSGQLNKVLRMLIADGSVNYTIPDKPGSRLR